MDRTSCRKCRESRPEGAGASSAGGFGGGADGGGNRGRPGDWNCSCGFKNFANRNTCKECQAEKRKGGRTGDGTDGKRRRTINARRNGEPDGQTGASGEKRATKRENGTGGAETSGGWRATKRENGTGGAEKSGGWRATKRENGTGGAEKSGGWRATKRENGTGGAEKAGGWRATKRENWHGRGGNVGRMARDETGKLARAGRKPQARRREDRC